MRANKNFDDVNEDIIDVEEDDVSGDWAEELEKHKRAEATQQEQQEQLIMNTLINSDPLYVSTLSFLAALVSNSSNRAMNMSNESKIYTAKQLAKELMESMNEKH